MDSPKCQECLEAGVISQTYKVAGAPLYKCHATGKLYPASSFVEIDFRWRETPDLWREAKHIPKGVGLSEGSRFKVPGVRGASRPKKSGVRK